MNHNHKAAAKIHTFRRICGRYNRVPTPDKVNKMRLSIINKTCFLWRDCGKTIEAIAEFENIHIPVVYNKEIDEVVTVGVSLCGKHSESI